MKQQNLFGSNLNIRIQKGKFLVKIEDLLVTEPLGIEAYTFFYDNLLRLVGI